MCQHTVRRLGTQHTEDLTGDSDSYAAAAVGKLGWIGCFQEIAVNKYNFCTASHMFCRLHPG